MITLIVTILVVYLGWLVVMPFVRRYLARKMSERVQDMFAQQFGMPNAREARRRYDEARREQDATRRRGRKIFSRDEGEYIEFEEISVTQTSASSTYVPPSSSPSEPQVSDAEWEEI